MTGQFDRNVVVTFSDGTSFFDVSGLRVQFAITKQIMHYANTCDLTIYNLKESTRNKIQGLNVAGEGYQHVTVKVGYGDAESSLLFDGDIRNIFHRREGADILSICYCFDGGSAIEKTTTSKSRVAGSGVLSLLYEIANSDLRVPIGEINVDISGNATFGPSGFQFQGKTEDCLNKLADAYRFNWFILNGKFYAVGENKVLNNFPVNTISQTTGMIGSPTITELGMDVKTLLNPLLSPGARVSVTSEGTVTNFQNMNFYSTKAITKNASIDGRVFKILKAVHTGDSRGNEWYTDIETQANWQSQLTAF